MSTNEVALYTVLFIFFLIAAGMSAAITILLSPPVLILIPLLIGFGTSLVSAFMILSILTSK